MTSLGVLLRIGILERVFFFFLFYFFFFEVGPPTSIIPLRDRLLPIVFVMCTEAYTILWPAKDGPSLADMMPCMSVHTDFASAHPPPS